jgi:hypothetical protein
VFQYDGHADFCRLLAKPGQRDGALTVVAAGLSPLGGGTGLEDTRGIGGPLLDCLAVIMATLRARA